MLGSHTELASETSSVPGKQPKTSRLIFSPVRALFAWIFKVWTSRWSLHSSGGGEADRTNLKYSGFSVGVPTCIQQLGGYCSLLNYERMLLEFRSEDRSSGIQPTPC